MKSLRLTEWHAVIWAFKHRSLAFLISFVFRKPFGDLFIPLQESCLPCFPALGFSVTNIF